MMKKNVLLFIVLFLENSVYSQMPEKEGLLWKISGNGLKQSSYLFGTYHGTYSIGADFLDSIHGFYNAFNSVTQYVGESDFSPETVKVLSEYLTKYFGERQMPTDTTYENLLNKNDYEFLDLTVRVSLSRFMKDVTTIRPNYLWFMIAQAKSSDFLQSVLNVPKKEVMDFYLQKIARNKGYTIKGLDSSDILMKSFELLYGTTPLPQSLQESADTLINNIKRLDKTLKSVYSPKFVRNIKNFDNAYKHQDLFGLEKYKKEQIEMMKNISNLTFDMDFLLKERSLLWVEKIPELISSQSTMIGVGAMHLCGKDGLISLLRQKGYQLEIVK